MAIFKCPSCGHELQVHKYDPPDLDPIHFGSGGWQPRYDMPDSSRSLAPLSESAQGLPAFKSAYRSTPLRPPEQTDWQVPLMQSIITAIIVGVPGGFVASKTVKWFAWWAFYDRISPSPWLWMVAGFVVCLAVVWLWRLRVYHSLLMRVEEVIGADLTGDNQVGPPPVRVEVDHKEQDDREHFEFEDLPTSKKRGYAGLITFARAISEQGETFSERSAAGLGGYSRAEWQDLRDRFIRHGWAYWNDESNPQQGVTLAAAGRAVLRRIASSRIPRTAWEDGRES